MAPVIVQARREPRRWRPIVISTGQQADLVNSALDSLGIVADVDLQVMRPHQPLSQLTGQCISRIGEVLRDVSPRLVVVQGDTASAVAGALSAFYERIPVAHVEAGLRTMDLSAPFPEEANRRIVSRVAKLHFSPTVDAKANLLAEGIPAHEITVTGNTVVDAIQMLTPYIQSTSFELDCPNDARVVLVTAHRRENLGKPLRSVCEALRDLADRHRDLHMVFVTHPNPAARAMAQRQLQAHPRITLSPPLPYLGLLRLMSCSWLILTDSGGLQEEAPSFGRPVLVLRHQTERTEGLLAGCARLVGTAKDRIVSEVERLIDDPSQYAQMVPRSNPYGDGKASRRIMKSITKFIQAGALRSSAVCQTG